MSFYLLLYLPFLPPSVYCFCLFTVSYVSSYFVCFILCFIFVYYAYII
ncbi:hypothetical protein HMPREF3204_00769 [Gardnerella pickettii]|nr:hypothetical protein HMPREF3204_00769 [Gardnerella pickettii]